MSLNKRTFSHRGTPTLTIREAQSNFVIYLEARYPFRDRRKQQQVIKSFFSWLIRHKPRQNWLNVNRTDILEYLKYRQHQKSYRKNTLLVEIRALKTFFKFLTEENILQVNPTTGQLPLAWTRKAEPRVPLSAQEVNQIREEIIRPSRPKFKGKRNVRNKLYAKLPAGNVLHRTTRSDLRYKAPHDRVARDWAAFELLQETGVRLEELVNIRLCDLNLEHRTAIIRKGKGGKERKIFFGKNSLLALQSFLPIAMKRAVAGNKQNPKLTGAEISNKEFVFKGFAPYQIRWTLKQYAKNAGISKKVFPHIFRHGFITTMHAKTGNLPVIQKLVGHSNIMTTSRYLHPSEETIEKTYRKAFDSNE